MSIQHTVSSGETLNSISQKYGFSNYKTAGITSVPSGNFDLIRPGEVITMNDQPRAVQQTTTPDRIQTKKNLSTFDQLLADQEANRANQAKTTTTTTDTTTKDTTTSEDLFSNTSPTGQKVLAIQEEGKKRITDITNSLTNLQSSMDASTNSLINSIKQVYGARIEDMKDSNKRLLATKEQVGIRSGRERYMPVIQSGILTDEEIQGHERISKLEGEMLGLVAKAEQARSENNYKLFNSNYEKLNEITKQMKDEISNAYELAVKVDTERKQARATEIKAQADLFDQMLDRSERSAPAVAKAMERFTSEADKVAFLKTYSAKTGIDVDVLLGDIETYSTKQAKSTLDIENIRNQIATRSDANARGWSAEDRARENQMGTKEEISMVKKYLAGRGASNSDIEKTLNDPAVFSYALSLAEGESE